MVSCMDAWVYIFILENLVWTAMERTEKIIAMFRRGAED